MQALATRHTTSWTVYNNQKTSHGRRILGFFQGGSNTRDIVTDDTSNNEARDVRPPSQINCDWVAFTNSDNEGCDKKKKGGNSPSEKPPSFSLGPEKGICFRIHETVVSGPTDNVNFPT
ncbi:hypothetical protein GCM10007868_11520 [Gluconobacter frateurii]|uniref:Uncharacterized protein n=1 Tax=Gluconobacter frateurii NRIC 0228 TaxID=1307946 RepID=A0ABQ0QDR6_9PROT|nr:hypothetical protein AA0228_2283 [Gluconobacter frateurii NRIC 0228]GLP90077.1 hypothetical protein GCM10007868_11520 [Gluconobacter frateurii]